jgi:hypothetical protein
MFHYLRTNAGPVVLCSLAAYAFVFGVYAISPSYRTSWMLVSNLVPNVAFLTIAALVAGGFRRPALLLVLVGLSASAFYVGVTALLSYVTPKFLVEASRPALMTLVLVGLLSVWRITCEDAVPQQLTSADR